MRNLLHKGNRQPSTDVTYYADEFKRQSKTTHREISHEPCMYFHIILNKYFEFTWQLEGLI